MPHRRVYVVAMEPANVLPGDGPVGTMHRGDPPLLAAERRPARN